MTDDHKRQSALSTPSTLSDRARRIYSAPHPALAMLASPFREFADADAPQKLFAFIAGFVSTLLGNAFATLLPIAVLASITDFTLGRFRARREEAVDGELRFDPIVGQIGFAVKITTYTQLFILWLGEIWLAVQLTGLVADTGLHIPLWIIAVLQGGWVTTSLLFGFFVVEIDSVEAHKIAMGKGPIPGWHVLSKGVRRILNWWAGRVVSGGEPFPPGGGGGAESLSQETEDERILRLIREESDRRRGKPPTEAKHHNGTDN